MRIHQVEIEETSFTDLLLNGDLDILVDLEPEVWELKESSFQELPFVPSFDRKDWFVPSFGE